MQIFQVNPIGKKGQLLITTNTNGTTEYTYDGRGQLKKTVLGSRITPSDNTSFANTAAITVNTPTGVSIKATYW